MHITEYQILWVRILQYLNQEIGVFWNIWIRNKFRLHKREKLQSWRNT